MNARTSAWLCVMMLTLPLMGQTFPPAAEPSTQPTLPTAGRWRGVLTGTNVYVRYGPGQQAYACTKLSTPDEVVVVGRTDGWLRIEAPKGCFSVISKDYVALDETGQEGTVTGNNVWVRAGGDLRTSDFIGVQRQLDRGARVEVLGEIGDYYKIVPPKGAYFYISDLYVRPLAEAEPEVEVEEAPLTPRVTEPTEVERVVPALPTTRPARATTSEKLAAFKRAEKVLFAEFKKPLEQRDLKKVRSHYAAIPLAEDDALAPYVEARLAFLDQSCQDMRDLERMKAMAESTAEKLAEYEKMRSQLQTVAPPSEPVQVPAAKGVLRPSMVFAGTGAIGKRYMLIDPTTDHVAAYVYSTSGPIDLDKFIGMNVAIYGVRRFDAQLRCPIVDPSEIQVLGRAGELPEPPQPIIRPRQPVSQPAPKPEPQAPPAPPAPKPKPPTAPSPKAPEMPRSVPAPAPVTTRPSPTTAPAEGLPVVTDKSPFTEPINEEEYE